MLISMLASLFINKINLRKTPFSDPRGVIILQILSYNFGDF